MKFHKQFYFFLGVALVFFSIAFGIEKYHNKQRLLRTYTTLIATNLHQQQDKLDEYLSNETFIKKVFQYNTDDITHIKELSESSFNLCFYQNDTLIFWSNSIAFPTDSILERIDEIANNPVLKKFSNGYFVVQSHPLSLANNKNQYAVSIIPVKWAYTEKIKHLKTRFEADNKRKIPSKVKITSSTNDYPVMTRENKPLFYLECPDEFKDASISKWVLFFYMMGFLFLCITINKITHQLIEKYRPWVGPTFLLSAVFGIRYLSLDWSAKFQNFQVFSRSFDNPHVSVGDLLINIVLLLWVVIFIHRESKNKNFATNFTAKTRLFLTSMNYLSVVLALLLLISVLKSLVLNSGIDFDFKNVFSLDQYSIFAVIGVILLLFTQFVFSHRMMITIHKLGLSRANRLLALALSLLPAIPIIYFIDLQIPLLYTVLISFIFVLTYDLFIDIPDPGLVWLVSWVILFAGFSSSLLYKYNRDKEIANEIGMAKVLATERDTIAETALVKFSNSLQNETDDLYAHFNPSLLKQLKEKIATIHFNENYLYTNYDYNIHFFKEDNQSYYPFNSTESLSDFQSIHQKILASKPIIPDSDISFHQDDKGGFSYLLTKETPETKAVNTPSKIFIEFSKAPRKSLKVYTKLLSNLEYKGLKDLSEYDYAIIKNGKPIIEEGVTDPIFEKEPKIGDYERVSFKDLIYFMYRFGPKDYIILSKSKNNLFHPISLFSFIFVFLTIMVLLFALLNSKLNILPNNFNFNFWNKPSLKNRIQFSTIILVLTSFIIIGIVSVYFLTDSFKSYDKSRLERKVSGVKKSAEQYLHLEKDSISLLKKHVPELAEAQRIDVNLYDLNGQLIQASEIDIFRRGILPSAMNAYAFNYLKKTSKADLVKIEASISKEHFVSAFTPIMNSSGNKVAYLEIPYANYQRNLQTDVSQFMGNLLNTYVFLLIIAGGFSVYVANTITKPISTIGENLKELKLGKPNEPLEWRTNDEIGALIAEYNRMILKLEHSAKLLARSEREGAWREMAKQVAHEIKNPLTPMKLSIQYLQHAFKSSPENIEPLLKRVSNTLIEQIDSLAQIASEFSNFAKMPRANNQQIKLNDLVESVHDLFKESKNTEVLLSLPNNDFYVFADKNHLMRVLNNMIKNAIEAIPDSRSGKIDVSLYKMNEMAVIKVEDNGVGIPLEMQDKVFVPNFTTKNSGTGLGLAISKNIIESVSGKIYFETEKDIGTSFFVELPLEDMITN